MRTQRLLEYIRIMKSIAGKRHKGRNGKIKEILVAMEKEMKLPWYKNPGPIEIPTQPVKKAITIGPDQTLTFTDGLDDEWDKGVNP